MTGRRHRSRSWWRRAPAGRGRARHRYGPGGAEGAGLLAGGMRWLLLLMVGGVFLVYGALEVPEGDCGEEAAEPGGGPQIFDGTGQEGPGSVSGAAGVVGGVGGGGFEEVGEFGDAGVVGYLSAPARCRFAELGDTAAVPGCQA